MSDTSQSAALVTGIKELIGKIEGESWSDIEGSDFVW
jgi:hypothetical protein